MRYSTGTPYDFSPFEGGTFSREAFPHTVSGAVALTLSMLAGGFILYAHSTAMLYAPPDAAASVEEAPAVGLPVINAPVVYEVPAVAPAVTAAPSGYGALAAEPAVAAAPSVREAPAGTPAATVASNAYGALLDPTFSLGFAPVSLAQSSPLGSDFQPIAPARPTTIVENVVPMPIPMPADLAQSIPLPAPRPPELQSPASPGASSGRQLAQQNRTTVPASVPSDHPPFFEKLFGARRSSGPVLAYAAPEDGVGGDERRSTPGPVPTDRWTAVYDIAAHTVYMPDGTKLEAHSGRGNMLDDPRFVNQHMRGATPPNVYDLQPREQLFHGVQALRLIPVGNNGVYGRAGLLAHTYMLGPHGDSFGCVSFRNYNAFLQAYLRGEVKRLTVVARLN